MRKRAKIINLSVPFISVIFIFIICASIGVAPALAYPLGANPAANQPNSRDASAINLSNINLNDMEAQISNFSATIYSFFQGINFSSFGLFSMGNLQDQSFTPLNGGSNGNILTQILNIVKELFLYILSLLIQFINWARISFPQLNIPSVPNVSAIGSALHTK